MSPIGAVSSSRRGTVPGAGEPGHRPRQIHSPRVRRMAADRGIAPDTLVGTGHRGRVTPTDVTTAGEVAARVARSPSAGQRESLDPAARHTPAATGSASVTVDVTRQVAADLLPVVLAAAVSALRHTAVGTAIDVEVTRHLASGVERRRVSDAHDLGVDGVRKALSRHEIETERSEHSNGARLSVHDVAALGLHTVAPVHSPGDVAALGVGAPVERPRVVRADGGWGVGVSTTVTLTLVWPGDVDDALDGPRLLALIRDRLAPPPRKETT
ncbi:MAG: 2-oxoglutarate dehydrogenase, component, dihydrolipoamide succinyltransferase [Humibacillus sp.]|nr:2-oxoglutarate dehydrogenase, component, dihydrolipoamide succinyltransferase [Humibacillus sp.]